MSKPIIKANLKGSDRVELVYNDRTVEMTITDFFNSLPASTLVISNTPSPATSGIYSGSGYLPGNITVNGLAGYTIYFKAIDEFKVFANKFLLENGECTFTSGNYEGTINIDTLTANRTYTLPDITGEIQVGPAVKKYKALISQNAPVATTTDPEMVAGQIWTLEAYNAADAATIAALELVSGTLYAVGSKYRSSTDQTLSVNAATTFSYDGSPYVVSTDVNGDLNPFLDTINDNIRFSYDGVGVVECDAGFQRSKTIVKFGNSHDSALGSTFNFSIYPDNKIYLETCIEPITDGGGSLKGVPELADGVAYYTPFEIEVYP